MISKFLVTIEFRYTDFVDDDTKYKIKVLTIGVYDCFNDACLNGNNILEVMENKFELHTFPDGTKANKERLIKKNQLISNLAYLKTPFQFYLKITELKYDEIEQTIDEVLSATERSRTEFAGRHYE